MDEEGSVMGDEEISLVKQLAQARRAKAEWEKLEKDLRGQLLNTLRASPGLRAITASGAPVAHISVTTRHSVDSKKLQALFPEVYEAVVTETEIEKLNIDLS